MTVLKMVTTKWAVIFNWLYYTPILLFFSVIVCLYLHMSNLSLILCLLLVGVGLSALLMALNAIFIDNHNLNDTYLLFICAYLFMIINIVLYYFLPQTAQIAVTTIALLALCIPIGNGFIDILTWVSTKKKKINKTL